MLLLVGGHVGMVWSEVRGTLGKAESVAPPMPSDANASKKRNTALLEENASAIN